MTISGYNMTAKTVSTKPVWTWMRMRRYQLITRANISPLPSSNQMSLKRVTRFGSGSISQSSCQILAVYLPQFSAWHPLLWVASIDKPWGRHYSTSSTVRLMKGLKMFSRSMISSTVLNSLARSLKQEWRRAESCTVATISPFFSWPWHISVVASSAAGASRFAWRIVFRRIINSNWRWSEWERRLTSRRSFQAIVSRTYYTRPSCLPANAMQSNWVASLSLLTWMCKLKLPLEQIRRT